jgi:uncharacterized protein (DUF488 family)
MTLYTIGFAGKTAEGFFTLLRESRVARIIDVRLNNTSQLAGFTKRADLGFFLRELCDADYLHLPQCAPTKQMLRAFKKERGDWAAYATAFNRLMKERQVKDTVNGELLDRGCLLCSEHSPEHCHRRLVAEYFQKHHPKLRVVHLGAG